MKHGRVLEEARLVVTDWIAFVVFLLGFHFDLLGP
jgi:hypothetical protein